MHGHAKVAIYSCLVNFVLMVVKYWLGTISGSLALKADAIHSLADVISSFTIFAGIVIADRKTKTFPEGLYKVENLVAFFSSLFIFYAAYEIASEALFGETLGRIEQLPLVSAGIFAIILAAFLFSRYELKVGLQAGSPSLVADAKHVSTDVLSSLVILLGIVGTSLGYDIDRYVALFVAVVVAHIGYQILIESLKVLLDATLDYPTLDGIRKILESSPEVTEVVSLGGRSSGRYKFVEVTLRMHSKLLREAHRITSQLEEEILDQWPNIDKILVHYEPEQKEFELIATPLDVPPATSPGPDSRLSGHFGEAPYFAFVLKNLRNGAVYVDGFAENPYKTLERRKGVKVAEFLAERGVDQVRMQASLEGTGAAYALEAMNIDVLRTDAETLGDVVTGLERDS